MAPPTIVRFGVFEVDLRSGELRKRGIRIRIPDQPFQILAALLEQPGQLVTREELRQRLWPADTFVDFDHSLNAAIKRLRDALGESADAPAMIETLPKRGYRFLGAVARIEQPSSAAMEAPTAGLASPDKLEVRAEPSRLRRSALPVALTLLALLIVGGFLAKTRLVNPLSANPAARVIPFTTDEGAEMDPSISTDGRQVAFVKWDGHSNFNADVFLKLIGGNEELQLTHGSGWACCTTWSADGLNVAYERCGVSPGIYVLPSLAGAERRLTASSCNGISWSPDGGWIAYVQDDRPRSPRAIFLIRPDGEQMHRLTSPPNSEQGDRLPSYSPDGSMLAFVRVTSAWVADLYVMRLSGGEPRRLTSDHTGITGMAWTPDSRSIVFASKRGGALSLWKVPASGGPVTAVPFGGANVFQLSIARQGDRLLYTQGGIRPNIWQIGLDRAHKAEPARPLLVSTSGDGNPQFSPDGSRIALYSQRSGQAEIWACQADGGNRIQLTSLGVVSETPRWSPDGAMLAFDSRPTGHSQLYLISATGGAPRALTSGESENTVSSWSRNGQWIYFGSNRGGSWQIWKLPPSGGEPTQVTDNGGFAGFESADGRYLYYAKEEEPGLWKRAVAGGSESKVFDGKFSAVQWALGRNGAYFVDSGGTQATVNYYDFVSHEISRLAALEHPVPPDEAAFDVSPDESRILVMQVLTDQDIMLVENFR